MSLSFFLYVAATIFRKIGRFFLHWYVQGSQVFWHMALDFLGELERTVSLRITIHNWYRPLYGDYTPLGFGVGIPIRALRIFLSFVLYAMLTAFFGLLYLVWLAIPVFLLSRLT